MRGQRQSCCLKKSSQNKPARLHSKYLRQLLKLLPGTCTTLLMLELGEVFLQGRWLLCCIRFGNRILSLPVDDLYRAVLSDSVLNNVGFAREKEKSITHF